MSGRRCLAGLIGANILQSLSPALHEDAFAAAGISGHYHLMDVSRMRGQADLADIVASIRRLGFVGVNVTFPFKERIIPLLEELAPEAAVIGAVNTVVVGDDGRLTGHNTDCSGFRRAFEETLGRDAATEGEVVLVGAGGAGRAVGTALLDLGVASLSIYDQSVERAKALASDLEGRANAGVDAATDLADAMRRSSGAVNATPIGMLGHPGSVLPPELIAARHWIADVVYTPMETQMIGSARAKGCRVMTGGGMCVHQAAEAFRLFTGVAPDIGRMANVFDKACAARDARLIRS